MTDQEQFTEQLKAALEPLMERIQALKDSPAPEKQPDMAAIEAAEKAKAINDIKQWSSKK